MLLTLQFKALPLNPQALYAWRGANGSKALGSTQTNNISKEKNSWQVEFPLGR